MGTDINGFVEFRAGRADMGERDVVWRAAVDLDRLNDTRNYDAFGCLFGVRNFANFRPLAAERGRPVDASEEVRAELDRLALWPDQLYGTTWITWAELKAVDWDEPAERPDSRIHQYRQTPDGRRFVGKAGWDARFAQALNLSQRPSDPRPTWPEGTEWLIGDTLYRSETLRRRDAVGEDGEWKPVWDAMEKLASQHGDDHVRLVVWFDD
ncbi:hypothetical protein OG883_01205 [Streptomyces sp. NBC_01142]|uniref:hypothetical protein n=1 Tax=Streptomyces sp. NBC_01142 TaxID=2975865 RepID=UPI00224DCEEE|nr:hypothetical protein [Streptomyces sp. NBC_01142]MCX4818546.1 hypothetical protein [Streptomyces sp. NBC_01142]